MLNDYLSGEEAKERIKQCIQDAETDSLLRRLGYRRNGTTRWIFAFLILIAAVTVGLLL